MDYKKYRLSAKELITNFLVYFISVIIASYLFYDSFIPSVIFLPGFLIYIKWIKKSNRKKREEKLKTEFCEMISALSDSLNAGFSVENSFSESKKDMERLFGNDAMIVKELDKIIFCRDVNSSTEAALNDFALRAGIEDITNFALIFSEVKKSGGNLREIIKKTISMIKDKSAIENEISVMLKGKVLEQKIMSIIPFIIMIFLRITCGEFMDTLYHNITGICIMSLCLVIYVLSIVFSLKIINIRV